MQKRSLLIYEKPPTPEEVIKRAEVWKEIFDAKDRKEPLEVVVNRHVRDDIYEILYKDTVKGLMKSPKEHKVGERVKVSVIIADYTTKTFRTKLYQGKPARFKVGDVLTGKVLKVTSKGGLIVVINGQKCLVPRNRLGPALRYPIRDIKRGEVECLILRVEGNKVLAEILGVRI